MVNLLDVYGFTVKLRTSVRFEPWKLKKTKKKLFTPILQKVSSIALHISKNRYSRQVKRKRIENN